MVLPHTNPGFPAPRSAKLRPPERARDVLWDRPVFRPPDLSNWRVIFDPMPFRAHDFRRKPR
ncbi:MAG: hypothetical protein RL324_868 [Verrucomicrobiota bacterium]|jgi:hypothetical protein